MPLILKETKEPELFLRTILDCAVGGIQQFNSPADIDSGSSSQKVKTRQLKERSKSSRIG